MSRQLQKLILRKLEKNYMQIPMSLPRQLATRIEGIQKVNKQVTRNRGISERRKQNIRR